MGGRGLLCCMAIAAACAAGCDEEPAPALSIEIEAAHRACEEGDACGVVETSCQSQGCKCGVAVNEAYLLDYQKQLAECRGQNEVTTCNFECETPFGKCFRGACVLTGEPPELFRRGRSVQALCRGSRGTYVGCADCPPNERCKSCVPCECPSTHKWTRRGCRAIVQTEPRDLRVEARPPVVNSSEAVKTRVHNDSKRKIWLKTKCGTPFYRARKKEDEWEKRYERFQSRKCREDSIPITPGASRPFVVGNLSDFKEPSGELAAPGTYRFEVTYTDGGDDFRCYGVVYSTEFDLVATTTGPQQAVR